MHDRKKVISANMPCIRCGYNLRGLTTDMACPECSAQISNSTYGAVLAFADPAWIAQLLRGTTLKLWAMLFEVLGALVVSIVVRVVGASQQIELLLLVPAALLGLWAVFLITVQEPRVSLSEDTLTLRNLVRFCAVIAFFYEPTKALLGSFTGPARTAGVVIVVVTICLDLIATFGEFVYYRRFARRLLNESLSRSTTVVMWGMAASMLIMIIGILIILPLWGVGILTGAPTGNPARSANAYGAIFVFFAGGIGLVIFGIWNIVLLFRYKKAFTDALATARSVLAQSNSLG